MAPIHEIGDKFYVRAVVTGSTEDEINSLITDYMSRYMPEGYGTEVIQVPTYMGGDLWEAKLRRSSSCE